MPDPASQAPTRVRLQRLLATLLWDARDLYADIYGKHLLDEDAECPDVELVELTEDDRIEILAEGQDFVLSVEPRHKASRHESAAISHASPPSPEERFATEVIEASRECGEMTLEELRRILSITANNSFCRYWINWFDSAPSSGRPALMALCAVNDDGSPARLYEQEMRERGFAKRTDPEGLEFWFVRRVDEEGNPWRSRPPSG